MTTILIRTITQSSALPLSNPIYNTTPNASLITLYNPLTRPLIHFQTQFLLLHTITQSPSLQSNPISNTTSNTCFPGMSSYRSFLTTFAFSPSNSFSNTHPLQHTLSTHPTNTPYQHTLSNTPFNTPSLQFIPHPTTPTPSTTHPPTTTPLPNTPSNSLTLPLCNSFPTLQHTNSQACLQKMHERNIANNYSEVTTLDHASITPCNTLSQYHTTHTTYILLIYSVMRMFDCNHRAHSQ